MIVMSVMNMTPVKVLVVVTEYFLVRVRKAIVNVANLCANVSLLLGLERVELVEMGSLKARNNVSFNV